MEELLRNEKFIKLVRNSNYTVSYKTFLALNYSLLKSYKMLEQLKQFFRDNNIKYYIVRNDNVISVDKNDFERLLVNSKILSELIKELREKYLIDVADNDDVFLIIKKIAERIDKLIENNKMLEQLLHQQQQEKSL